ncbi:MAG: CRISPR-associated endonuclease Cas2 [Planctomycetota bacterium]|nr:MAG: CRISPR-associated endonuclease Cas2 [Planctomycetota bacterium]
MSDPQAPGHLPHRHHGVRPNHDHPGAGASPAHEQHLPPDLRTFPARPHIVFDHSTRHTYLVAYDVREAGRLRAIHKNLKDWGEPVQYSVFECFLTGPEVEHMWAMVEETIDCEVDWVILYRLSRPYNEAVRNIGVYDPLHIDADTIIFI